VNNNNKLIFSTYFLFFSSIRIKFSRLVVFPSYNSTAINLDFFTFLRTRDANFNTVLSRVLNERKYFFVAVLNELEGLARGADARDCPPASKAALNPEHVARVAENAKAALAFARSRNPAIRCLTTRGTVLSSSTFTVEEDVDKVRNWANLDDSISLTFAF